MVYFNHNRENCEEVRVNHKYINKRGKREYGNGN